MKIYMINSSRRMADFMYHIINRYKIYKYIYIHAKDIKEFGHWNYLVLLSINLQITARKREVTFKLKENILDTSRTARTLRSTFKLRENIRDKSRTDRTLRSTFKLKENTRAK